MLNQPNAVSTPSPASESPLSAQLPFFEIHDYTLATEWEGEVAAVERALTTAVEGIAVPLLNQSLVLRQSSVPSACLPPQQQNQKNQTQSHRDKPHQPRGGGADSSGGGGGGAGGGAGAGFYAEKQQALSSPRGIEAAEASCADQISIVEQWLPPLLLHLDFISKRRALCSSAAVAGSNKKESSSISPLLTYGPPLPLLHRWSGFPEFLYITAASENNSSADSAAAISTSASVATPFIVDSSTNRFLSSTLTLALSHIHHSQQQQQQQLNLSKLARLPILIPLGNPEKFLFTGIQLGGSNGTTPDEDEWFHGQAYSSSTGGGGGGGQRFKMHALPNSSTSSIDVKDLTGMIRFFDAQDPHRFDLQPPRGSVSGGGAGGNYYIPPLSITSCFTFNYTNDSDIPLPLHLYSSSDDNGPNQIQELISSNHHHHQPAISINLPVGPPFDPLVSLSLEAFFNANGRLLDRSGSGGGGRVGGGERGPSATASTASATAGLYPLEDPDYSQSSSLLFPTLSAASFSSTVTSSSISSSNSTSSSLSARLSAHLLMNTNTTGSGTTTQKITPAAIVKDFINDFEKKCRRVEECTQFRLYAEFDCFFNNDEDDLDDKQQRENNNHSVNRDNSTSSATATIINPHHDITIKDLDSGEVITLSAAMAAAAAASVDTSSSNEISNSTLAAVSSTLVNINNKTKTRASVSAATTTNTNSNNSPEDLSGKLLIHSAMLAQIIASWRDLCVSSPITTSTTTTNVDDTTITQEDKRRSGGNDGHVSLVFDMGIVDGVEAYFNDIVNSSVDVLHHQDIIEMKERKKKKNKERFQKGKKSSSLLSKRTSFLFIGGGGGDSNIKSKMKKVGEAGTIKAKIVDKTKVVAKRGSDNNITSVTAKTSSTVNNNNCTNDKEQSSGVVDDEDDNIVVDEMEGKQALMEENGNEDDQDEDEDDDVYDEEENEKEEAIRLQKLALYTPPLTHGQLRSTLRFIFQSIRVPSINEFIMNNNNHSSSNSTSSSWSSPLHAAMTVFKERNVAVPPFSVFWNMAVKMLDCVSPSSSCLLQDDDFNQVNGDAGQDKSHNGGSNSGGGGGGGVDLIPYMIQIWKAVVDEVEWCWENDVLIAGVSSFDELPPPNLDEGETVEYIDTPLLKEQGIDMRYTLIHQKLQMMNNCILRRRRNRVKLQQAVATTATVPPSSTQSTQSTSLESGEYYRLELNRLYHGHYNRIHRAATPPASLLNQDASLTDDGGRQYSSSSASTNKSTTSLLKRMTNLFGVGSTSSSDAAPKDQTATAAAAAAVLEDNSIDEALGGDTEADTTMDSIDEMHEITDVSSILPESNDNKTNNAFTTTSTTSTSGIGALFDRITDSPVCNNSPVAAPSLPVSAPVVSSTPAPSAIALHSTTKPVAIPAAQASSSSSAAAVVSSTRSSTLTHQTLPVAGTSTGSRSPPLLFNNNDLVNSSDAVVGSWNSDRSWEEWGGGGGGGGSTLLKQTSNSSSAGAGVSRQFSSMTIKPRGESVPSSIETGNNSLGSTGSGGSGNNAVDDLVVVSAGTSWPGVGGISPRDFMPFKDRISGQNHPALVASADSSLQPSKAATTITTPSLAPITLPAGRLRKLPGVKLLNSVSSDQQGDGDNIWIPITQDEGFITEDMARDQELMFERMGTSKEAARERMRMQSQGLVSDMQAFKAANPTAILEDFVRWHSPRDFILVSESASAGGNNTLSDISSCSSTSTVSPSSDDVEVEEEGVVVVEKDGKEKIFRARVYKSGVCGSLSVRMMDPDNLWNELWRTCQPIPVSHQVPLFDEVSEAKRVLKYLKTQVTPHYLLIQLIPTILLVSYYTLSSHPITRRVGGIVADTVKSYGKELGRVDWSMFNPVETSAPDDLIKLVRDGEARIGMAISLLQKFPDQFDLVDRVLKSSEVLIKTSEVSSIKSAFKHITTPVSREFVIREQLKQPDALEEGYECPRREYGAGRRLYVGIQPNDVRLFISSPILE